MKVWITAILLVWNIKAECQSVRNFDFIIKWEIGMPNIYNSSTGKFQKDLVGAIYEGKFKLSKKEKRTILNKLNQIGFWDIPEVYTGTRKNQSDGSTLTMISTPCMYYTVTATLNGKTHTVRWSDNSKDLDVQKSFKDLNSLFQVIGSIVASHKQWKNSPPARGGYL